MKKYLFFLLLFFSAFVYAQDPTPNPGFENWSTITTCFPNSFISPNNWDNLNCETNILALTCTQDNSPHSGLYDVRLETKFIFNTAANGIITTGTIHVIGFSGTVSGGIPSHERPDSIFGWYKFFPGVDANTHVPDTTDIEMTLFKTDSVEVGYAKFQDWDTVANWTRFAVPIKYSSSDPPDTIRWLLSSSAGYTAIVGSIMYIDDLGTSFTTGVPSVKQSQLLHISADPSQNLIIVNADRPLSGYIHILDVAGRNLQTFYLDGKHGTFNVHNLANGTYSYEFADDSKKNIQRGMLIWMR